MHPDTERVNTYRHLVQNFFRSLAPPQNRHRYRAVPRLRSDARNLASGRHSIPTQQIDPAGGLVRGLPAALLLGLAAGRALALDGNGQPGDGQPYVWRSRRPESDVAAGARIDGHAGIRPLDVQAGDGAENG
jgi:hypothetical protein